MEPRYNLRTRVRAIDESQSDHQEESKEGPEQETMSATDVDIQKVEQEIKKITTGVTKVDLNKEFESWTIWPEEVGLIQDFLNETRLRETHPGWFPDDSRWNSQENLTEKVKVDTFEFWFSELRKYTFTPRQVELIKEFSDQLRNNDVRKFEIYVGKDPIRKILRSLAKTEASKEEVVEFKSFAQKCTANNESY